VVADLDPGGLITLAERTTATSTAEFQSNRVVDLTAPRWLVAQRGLFAGPSPLVSDDLYVEITEGRGDRTRAGLQLGPHGRATTNTYFGRFPASYWQRWTAVREVQVTVTASGSGRILVRASDPDGDARTVAVAPVDQPGRVSLPVAVDRFLDGGALWVECEAGESGLRLDDLAWTVDPPERLRAVVVVICTYNRADECVDTLTAIAEDPVLRHAADAVYVVDQGTDRVESRDGFARLSATLGDRLVYLPQPNLGGAGGFTRGLFEAMEAARGEHAHVIFMDDDILCEPETIARLTAFANRTVEPTIVGAQMLYLLHPTQLHVGAETADLPRLQAGVAAENALTAEDVTETQQEVRVDAGYTGWWSCLLPGEIVAEIGLPLPVFFQWDDIEYGFRARAAGYATVTLPGAGVWHADFGWKDWDDWHRYFNIRNALITAALHGSFDGVAIARGLVAQLVRYLVSMQYGLAHTLIKAVDDFCAGPRVLEDGGVAAAAAVRAERAAYPETARHPASSVPGLRLGEAMIAPGPPPPSLTRMVLAKRILTQALGRTNPEPVSIAAFDASWYHVSRFDTVVVTDASQEGVRLRRRDNAAARALLVRGLRAINRLRRRAPALRAQYRDALPVLTGRENWARLFGVARPGDRSTRAVG
jgi:galactofuranosylgalactofuranosylrhamnosyl-N-acetylglucosaminyl-diphospho-decaprenol beta-1,5/1,6-galactofuranosyltransferase